MANVYYLSTDNLLEVRDVQNVATSANLNSAVVTVTLYSGGTSATVSGQTWPLTLSYVTASSGLYRGTLADDLVTDDGDKLRAEIVVSGGAGLKATIIADIYTQRLIFP